MKRVLVASFASLGLVLSGCGGGVAEHAVGAYHLDKDAMTKVATTNQDAAAVARMVSSMQSTIELRADGTATMRMQFEDGGRKLDETFPASWQLEGDKLTFTRSGSGGKADSQTVDYVDGAFTLRSGGAVRMDLPYRSK